MRYWLIVILFISLSASAQEISDKQLKENMAKLDSQAESMNAALKESTRVIDSMNTARTTQQMARNLDAFMADRKEQERKKMQGIYWRLGFGVLLLILFVIGMKRKKKLQQ